MIEKIIRSSKIFEGSDEISIQCFPNEIWQKIFCELNLNDFISLKYTCKQLYISSPSEQLIKLWKEHIALSIAAAKKYNSQHLSLSCYHILSNRTFLCR